MNLNSLSLDGIDRDILRVLSIRSPMVQRQIAGFVGLSASAIQYRLVKLEEIGLLKKAKVDGIRNFIRNYKKGVVKIKSPRSIYWEINFIKK